MSFLTGVFIIILAGMGIGAISEIAKAIARRGGSATEQLAELQERVDFAERLLAQARDRASLGAGKPQP
jgi:hypothetical protein